MLWPMWKVSVATELWSYPQNNLVTYPCFTLGFSTKKSEISVTRNNVQIKWFPRATVGFFFSVFFHRVSDRDSDIDIPRGGPCVSENEERVLFEQKRCPGIGSKTNRQHKRQQAARPPGNFFPSVRSACSSRFSRALQFPPRCLLRPSPLPQGIAWPPCPGSAAAFSSR